LRWLFFRRRVAYPSGRLSPTHFIQSGTWDLDIPGLISEAAAVLNEGASNLAVQVEALRQRSANTWSVCNGHDLMSLLAIALRGPLRAKRKFPSDESVATGVRLAVDPSHLAKLRIWRAIGDWETRASCRVRRA
jgi:hypothetical protein